MNFTKHSNLEGSHAFLGASQPAWLNYDAEKLALVYSNKLAAARGTVLHAFAATCIKLHKELPDKPDALNQYVNDAIRYRLKPEQVLYYSDNCYGTADAINFIDNTLRIHDLKTGSGPVHMEQLMIYAALFCLEYDYHPANISIVLRIYQSGQYQEVEPAPEDIQRIMDKIIEFDEIIDDIRFKEGDAA